MDAFDTNHIQLDQASFTRKRKRPSAACARCHERKIKCDAVLSSGEVPCKNCVSAGVVCRRHVDGRTRAGLAQSQQPSTGRDTDQDHPQPIQYPGQLTPDPLHSATALNFPIQIPSPQTPNLSIERFEAYVEDNMGAYAPSFRLGADRNSGVGASISSGTNTSDAEVTPDVPSSHGLQLSDLITPPSPIHRVDVEMSTRTTLEIEKQVTDLDAADMAYLEAKGVFELPPLSLQTELIDAFFSAVHATAPVVNKTQFLADFRNGRSQSRLLLFSIFTAGARVCRSAALLDAKGTNHTSALRFYQATKALLDTGYERNKLVRIQALLLITWWWDKKDDGGRNMRSCVVDAINTAQSIGMHRWDQYPSSDMPLQRMWKRVWWYCVTRDAAVAVAHGLPCMPSLADTDVLPLTAEDFIEDTLGVSSTPYSGYTTVEVLFMIEQVRLSEALRKIHHRYFVQQRLNKQMTGSISDREIQLASGKTVLVNEADDYKDEGLNLCRQWLRHLPEPLKYNVDDVQGHQFWPAFLHILYYTGIMLRFREVSVSRLTSNRGHAERQYCRARGIAAATMVSKIIRNMRAHGHVLRCTGQLTNSLFNCLTFFLIEAQLPGIDVRQDARQKYTLCLNQLYEFSLLWISASLIHRLFEDLQGKLMVPEQRTNSSVVGMGGEHPWHELFPGLKTSSEITQPYMHQLIEADFPYAGGALDNSLGNSAASSLTLLSPEGDIWSGLDQPIIGGLPATLDADVWLDFFGMSDGRFD